MNDKEIKEKIERSREEGYRALFDEYWQYAYTIIYSILNKYGCARDAEDCTADVLSDVMIKYDTGTDGSLKAYIGTTARNRAIDIARSASKTNARSIEMESEEYEALPSSENIAEIAERSELTKILLDNIEALGEPDSVIIIQKYFFERSSVEIGKITGINPVTVRSRLKRALKKLKVQLERFDISL
ncbi:MAG: RNA polymerase sigma factor [Ruminococcus sp.]|nr:RNA polymerase sigma factor [Ruminococcus sp.]